MRLIFNIVLAFLAANASAKALLPRFVSQHALAEELPSVPGDNPLHYCASPDKDILEIESVDLSPNPPKAYVIIFSNNHASLDVKRLH